MKVLILNHDEVSALLPVEECIPVVKDALAALSGGRVYQPLRAIVSPPNAAGLMGLMPAYISGADIALGLKVVCVFRGNPSKGKDAHQGGVLLFSPETGELLGMFNASAITAIRTAAASGVATQLLAREDACELAVIGTGVQAGPHLAAMAHVRSIKRARVASLRPERARKFAVEMATRYSFPLEAVNSVEAAVRGADLIVIATNAVEPVLKRQWISPGAHLNLVGSSAPTSREADGATMAAATLFVDRRESAIAEAGEYLLAIKEGAIRSDHIRAEVGEVLNGMSPGRTSPDEITVFKSVGVAVEDVATARYLYEKALKTGSGTWVDY